MYVCLCKGITDTQIRAAVQDGAGSLRDVRSALGVASQCGKCGLLARQVVRDALTELPHTLEQAQDQAQEQLFYAAT